jgi:DNA-binding response OmpR family regulator
MQEVLLVEDDPSVQAALIRALSDKGFTVSPCGTALQALRYVADHEPDIVVLDLGLPDLDGSAVLPLLRSTTDAPVVVVTARRNEGSIVALLNAGADDYVVKPFSSEQLVARMSAVLRRARPAADADTVMVVGGLYVNRAERVASLDGRVLDLTRLEFDMLAYLACRAGKVVTRRELIRDVWRRQLSGADRTVDVHVSWLRRKLGETATRPRYLHTVRRVGWKLAAPDDTDDDRL